MADLKFSCPQCEQHIQADSGYSGMQISCPACNSALIVHGAAKPSIPAPVTATAPSPLQRQATTTSASGCPSCGGALPRGAALCTSCGYNLATGQRTVAGRVVAPGKSTAPQYESPWYKTPYPYLGLVALLMVLFYFLGKENPMMKLACICTAALYSLTVQIIVIVSGFKKSVGTGFLTMCLPFYGLYYVFRVQDSDNLKLLYGFATAINIGLLSID